MTEDFGTGELSSPATNGATGDSAAAISVPSNGGDKEIDGSDEKALSSVNFLINEINRLAEEISVRSNSGAKAADGSDEKALFTVKFLIAEINRLERTLYRHYDTLARFGKKLGDDARCPRRGNFRRLTRHYARQSV